MAAICQRMTILLQLVLMWLILHLAFIWCQKWVIWDTCALLWRLIIVKNTLKVKKNKCLYGCRRGVDGKPNGPLPIRWTTHSWCLRWYLVTAWYYTNTLCFIKWTKTCNARHTGYRQRHLLIGKCCPANVIRITIDIENDPKIENVRCICISNMVFTHSRTSTHTELMFVCLIEKPPRCKTAINCILVRFGNLAHQLVGMQFRKSLGNLTECHVIMRS